MPEPLDHPNPAPAGGICPLVGNFSPDCHCTQMTSLRIPQVLTWCGGNFQSCEIYRRWAMQHHGPAAPGSAASETPIAAPVRTADPTHRSSS